jgi:hypothetical protein
MQNRPVPVYSSQESKADLTPYKRCPTIPSTFSAKILCGKAQNIELHKEDN